MKPGFLGTGTIAAAVVEGIQSGPLPLDIVLSPRNADVARSLAERFPRVRVATSNQQVLDESDTVVIAVRPQIAHEVLSALQFRPDHHIISLVPAVSLEYLRKVTAPSAEVTRAVPLPSAAYRQAPTVIYPATSEVKRLFDQLGQAITLDSEDEFDAFTTATSVMSSYFAFAETTAAWLVQQGIPYSKARAYLAQMLRGLSAATQVVPDIPFSQLAEEHQTRGGLNEQVYQTATVDGKFVEIERGLDAVLQRLITGKSSQ